MSRYLDTSTKARRAKIMAKQSRTCGSIGTETLRTPPCWTIVRETVREGLGWKWMGVSTVLMRALSVRVCGMHSTWIQAEPQHRRRMQKTVRITVLRRSCRKAAWTWRCERKHFSMALQRGRTCEETRRSVLRVGKQKHRAPPCIDDHQFKPEELEQVGELSNVCSANMLAGAVMKWARACDKRLARLISYIHCTSNFKQYCNMGNTAQECRLGLDSDFAGDLESSRSTSGSMLCVFGCRTFEPLSWTCKKQTSVSHNTPEVVSLDAGLRKEGSLPWICGIQSSKCCIP